MLEIEGKPVRLFEASNIRKNLEIGDVANI
jgi:hypothetical protein